MRYLAVQIECDELIRRARLAYAFATSTMDADDAEAIKFICIPVSGIYPIASVSVDEIVEDFRDLYGDIDEIEDTIADLADEACDTVWRKWDSGELESAAREW